MTRHRTRRLATGAALLVLAAALTTGCTPDKVDVVAGTGGPTTGATAPGATPGSSATLGDALSAADVTGWTPAGTPDGEQGIVQPCDQPTGARAQQAAVRAAAMTTPTGITVRTQVADYTNTPPATVIRGTITSALVACPSYQAGAQDVTTRVLPSTGSTPAVGAEIVRTDTETGMREVTVYWAAQTGAGTVEVAVSATLGAVGESPLQEFALSVLSAAQLKATGQQVPPLPAPALPAARTLAEEEQARHQAEADNAQTADGGLDAGSVTDVPEDVANDTTSGLPSDWQYGTPGTGYTGGEGETGPGTISD